MNEELTLTLHPKEVESILAVLGDLPSRSGAWPLMMKLKQQIDAQMQPPEQADD